MISSSSHQLELSDPAVEAHTRVLPQQLRQLRRRDQHAISLWQTGSGSAATKRHRSLAGWAAEAPQPTRHRSLAGWQRKRKGISLWQIGSRGVKERQCVSLPHAAAPQPKASASGSLAAEQQGKPTVSLPRACARRGKAASVSLPHLRPRQRRGPPAVRRLQFARVCVCGCQSHLAKCRTQRQEMCGT